MRGGEKDIILVADDDPLIKSLMFKALGSMIQNNYAMNADELLKMYEELVPDILFLDIHLADKSGLDLIGQILKLDPNAFIIMLSADSSKENVIQAVKKGAKHFLTKPFLRQKLIEVINSCPTMSKKYI